MMLKIDIFLRFVHQPLQLEVPWKRSIWDHDCIMQIEIIEQRMARKCISLPARAISL